MKQIEDSTQDIDKYLEDMAASGWFSIMLICVQGKGRDGVYGHICSYYLEDPVPFAGTCTSFAFCASGKGIRLPRSSIRSFNPWGWAAAAISYLFFISLFMKRGSVVRWGAPSQLQISSIFSTMSPVPAKGTGSSR